MNDKEIGKIRLLFLIKILEEKELRCLFKIWVEILIATFSAFGNDIYSMNTSLWWPAAARLFFLLPSSRSCCAVFQ